MTLMILEDSCQTGSPSDYMILVMRKSVFGGSNQVRHESGCTAIEDGKRLETSDLENRGISIGYHADQSCTFVFAQAISRFFHGVAHIK